MKRKLLIVFLITLASCKDTPYFDKKTISEWAQRDADLPSRYSHMIMFVSLEDEQIAETDVGQLHTLYRTQYASRYSSFSDFLFVALNQHMTFQVHYFKNSIIFVKNTQIMTEAKRLGSQRFKHKYCDQRGSGCTIRKSLVSQRDELYTVMYALFLYSYSLNRDDYEGSIWVFARSLEP